MELSKFNWQMLAYHIIQLLTVLQIGYVFYRIWEYQWLGTDSFTAEVFQFILRGHVIFGLSLVVSLIIMSLTSIFNKHLLGVISGLLVLIYVSYRLLTF